MKCTIVREKILDSVLHAEKNTIKNHTLPVLSCILLTVIKEKLFLTATNLEVGVRFSVEVTDSEDGTVAVSGQVLSHVISSLPQGTAISFQKQEGYLHIVSSEGSSKIALQDTEDFPTLPEVSDATSISISSKKLHEAITKVVYCASTSTIKPELSSVYVHLDGSTLVTAATDSFRLAEQRIPLKKSVEAESFLIPGKSTSNLLRFLEKSTNDVSLKINNHQLSIEDEYTYITLRLTAGTFPDYTQIIPKEFITEATVLVYDFDRILKKATAFSDQYNQTTLSVLPSKKKFTVHTKNNTIGENTDSVTAAMSGEDLVINFNQKYLIDSIRSIQADSITIQFSGQSQPAVVRPIGDTGFLYLVMPMNR